MKFPLPTHKDYFELPLTKRWLYSSLKIHVFGGHQASRRNKGFLPRLDLLEVIDVLKPVSPSTTENLPPPNFHFSILLLSPLPCAPQGAPNSPLHPCPLPCAPQGDLTLLSTLAPCPVHTKGNRLTPLP